MRLIGTEARGIRLPIISKGDNLAEIVVDSVLKACEENKIALKDNDVVGITEAIVAKSQGNYASCDDIAKDVSAKFPEGTVGLVFPILSRNRFMNILKGISSGCKKVYVLLQYPDDEVGNPILDINTIDEIEDQLKNGPIPAKQFKEITGNYTHPFTDINYIDLYAGINENIEVYVSNDPRDILKLTDNVLVGEIHTRLRTKARLIKAGAKNVYTLSDILSSSIDGSGYNENYGVLGSNLATENSLKLFPRDCNSLVSEVSKRLSDASGKKIEVLIYGDGAFKDPVCGIWELADPVVSPAHTEKLTGKPNELKLKYVAENVFGNLSSSEKTVAITEMIKNKNNDVNNYAEGTTPRKYADLLGSLCDLMSGSGDKGTPVILIQGYFDDYASE